MSEIADRILEIAATGSVNTTVLSGSVLRNI